MDSLAPIPKASRAAASRQEILSASAKLFRARGYTDTSLRDVADAVGMKAGSLYYHFSSKEALATEVLRIGVDRVRETVTARLSEEAVNASGRVRIRVAVRAHLDTLLLESDFTSAHIRCFPYVPQPVRDELKAARRDYERVWAGLVEEAVGTSIDADRARYVRLAIIGALNWSLEWFDPDRDDPAAIADAINTILYAGLEI